MGNTNGVVKLFLAPGAKIPVWIMKWLEQHTDNFSVGLEEFHGSHVRVLKLIGGEASFCYPAKDDVVVKLPGEKHRWASGFDPTAVLQITNADGSVAEQNRHLCPRCHNTTGQISHHKVGQTVTAVYKCSPCLQEWEL